MRYQPVRLQTPAGYELAQAPHFFTPACTHVLGSAWYLPSLVPGSAYTEFAIVRWDRQGTAEVLLGRLHNPNSRVVGNESGLVVVSATRVVDGPAARPLAVTIGSSVVTDLGAPYPGETTVNDMNAAGVFIGTSRTLTGRIGFVATVNGMRVITPPAPAAEVSPNGINDSGVIVGTYYPTPGRPRGFVERGGVTEDLGEFVVSAVNNNAIAVARPATDPHAWGTIDLSQRPYELRPLALPRRCMTIHNASRIDDRGVVLGYCDWKPAPGMVQSTLLLHDASFTVDELIGRPGQLGFIEGLGRSGAISGFTGTDWFLAEPVPDAPPNPRAAVRPRLR